MSRSPRGGFRRRVRALHLIGGDLGPKRTARQTKRCDRPQRFGNAPSDPESGTATPPHHATRAGRSGAPPAPCKSTARTGYSRSENAMRPVSALPRLHRCAGSCRVPGHKKTLAAARQPSQAPMWRSGCGVGGTRRQVQDSGRRRKGATVLCRANQRGKRDDQHTASDLRNRRGIGRRCPRPSPCAGRTVVPVLRREIHERRLAQSPVPQVPQAQRGGLLLTAPPHARPARHRITTSRKQQNSGKRDVRR